MNGHGPWGGATQTETRNLLSLSARDRLLSLSYMYMYAVPLATRAIVQMLAD